MSHVSPYCCFFFLLSFLFCCCYCYCYFIFILFFLVALIVAPHFFCALLHSLLCLTLLMPCCFWSCALFFSHHALLLLDLAPCCFHALHLATFAPHTLFLHLALYYSHALLFSCLATLVPCASMLLCLVAPHVEPYYWHSCTLLLAFLCCFVVRALLPCHRALVLTFFK
jgi:hypothetical protein